MIAVEASGVDSLYYDYSLDHHSCVSHELHNSV